MKKKILILILLLTCSFSLLLVPVKKASAALGGDVSLSGESYFNTPGILYLYKTDFGYDADYHPYLRASGEANCSITFNFDEFYMPDMSFIYHDCIYSDGVYDDGGTCFKVYETDELLIIEFLNNDSYYIDDMECAYLDRIFYTTDRSIIPSGDVPGGSSDATLIDLYEYYYNSKDLSNSIYVSYYIPIETFETYDLESKKIALYNLIDAIKKQSNLDTAVNVYDAYYQKGFQDGKESVDITIDNQEQYDKGYLDGISSVDSMLDDLRFGPLVNSTFVSSLSGISYTDYRNLFFNFERLKNNYIVSNHINLYSLAYDTYTSFSPGSFENTLLDLSNAIFYDLYINFAKPINYLTLNVQGVSSVVLYREDGTFLEEKFIIEYNDPDELVSFMSFVNELDYISEDSPFISMKLVYSPTYLIKDSTHVSFGLSTKDSYTLGFEFGKDVGFKEGSSLSQDDAFDKGYEKGKFDGFDEGFNKKNFSFQNLFWTIAGLPFESMKTIWNVDFLGINLAQFLTGIFMFGVVIFIVKKVFLK